MLAGAETEVPPLPEVCTYLNLHLFGIGNAAKDGLSTSAQRLRVALTGLRSARQQVTDAMGVLPPEPKVQHQLLLVGGIANRHSMSMPELKRAIICVTGVLGPIVNLESLKWGQCRKEMHGCM